MVFFFDGYDDRQHIHATGRTASHGGRRGSPGPGLNDIRLAPGKNPLVCEACKRAGGFFSNSEVALEGLFSSRNITFHVVRFEQLSDFLKRFTTIPGTS